MGLLIKRLGQEEKLLLTKKNVSLMNILDLN
jgi:hypothetical protein